MCLCINLIIQYISQITSFYDVLACYTKYSAVHWVLQLSHESSRTMHKSQRREIDGATRDN